MIDYSAEPKTYIAIFIRPLGRFCAFVVEFTGEDWRIHEELKGTRFKENRFEEWLREVLEQYPPLKTIYGNDSQAVSAPIERMQLKISYGAKPIKHCTVKTEEINHEIMIDALAGDDPLMIFNGNAFSEKRRQEILRALEEPKSLLMPVDATALAIALSYPEHQRYPAMGTYRQQMPTVC